MPRQAGMKFKKFVTMVGDELIRRFFDNREAPLPASMQITDTALQQFLNNLPEEKHKEIDQVWESINEITEKGIGYMETAKEDDGVSTADDIPCEQMAMVLFLDYPETFRAARDRFICLTLAADVTGYPLPAKKAYFTQTQIKALEQEISNYYKLKNKGDDCVIKHYPEDGKDYLLIERSDYMKSDIKWENRQIKAFYYRPGREDVIVYDGKTLGIRYCSQGKGDIAKHKYVELFGKHILKTTLPLEVYTTSLISLEPFRNGAFNFKGNNVVKRIKLKEIKGIIE